MNQVLVRRGELIESAHTVHVAVSGTTGLVSRCGNPKTRTFLRSVAKPFQSLPLVTDGVVDALGFTGEELAVTAASHSSEPGHLNAARGVLAKAGVSEEFLGCGGHLPFHVPSGDALTRQGLAPIPIHNNCSGKHAGMLALAKHHGWPLEGYWQEDHPVQQRVRQDVAQWMDLEADAMDVGVDGCGVVTFAASLEAAALGFGRLARAGGGETAATRVLEAMWRHPWYVGGTGRLCTALMRAANGTIVAKVGAEGVYCAALLDRGLGIALKVEDGARRASEVALLEVLRQLGALEDEVLRGLKEYAAPTVLNTRGEEVGSIGANLVLEPTGPSS